MICVLLYFLFFIVYVRENAGWDTRCERAMTRARLSASDVVWSEVFAKTSMLHFSYVVWLIIEA